jgi:tape measure domain-containing protein
MSTEIASAYVALYTKMPGVEKDITKALGGVDGEKAGKSIGGSLMDGLNSIGKVGAIALGGTIVAGVGTALVKGFNRLNSLDQAEAKLTGLGHSAATVDEIMANALASVKGTAFGMDAAATAAANAVASGVKPGDDLTRTLKLVADAATIAGTDMGSMGAIFNKVAASNKVQMDVINQLHDAGVPALALLADQMGVTAEEASKMASAGEIDFGTFQAAMEKGMGGAALESGNTFSGAMDNIMASLGRMGAGVLSGIFPEMKDGLKGVLDAMAPLEDAAKNVGKAIGEFIGWVKDNWSWLQPFAIGLGIVAAAVVLWTVAQWALNAAMTANPVGFIIVAIGLLIGAIILLVENWDTVVAWISDVWDGFVSWLVDIIEGVAAWWNDIWASITGFFEDTWNGIVDWFMSIPMFAWLIEMIQFVSSNWDLIWESVAKVFEDVWNGIVDFFKGTINTILDGVEWMVNGAIDLINGMTGGVSAAWTWIPGLEDAAIPKIPRVSIPRLADGAVVNARAGGTAAIIGEGRYDEAVLPLGGPQLDRVREALGSDRPVENHFHMPEADVHVLARLVARELRGI